MKFNIETPCSESNGKINADASPSAIPIKYFIQIFIIIIIACLYKIENICYNNVYGKDNFDCW